MMKSNSHDITWDEIEKYIDKDTYKNFLKHISLSVFETASKEQNRSKVVKIVLKVLQESNPQNATEEYAQKIVDAIQKVAKEVLKKKKHVK